MKKKRYDIDFAILVMYCMQRNNHTVNQYRPQEFRIHTHCQIKSPIPSELNGIISRTQVEKRLKMRVNCHIAYHFCLVRAKEA